MSEIFEIKKVILNEDGLHARPAGVLAKKASGYISKIELVFSGRTVNAKSAMSLMTLGLQKGSEITLKADGADSTEALTALSLLIDQNFKALEL